MFRMKRILLLVVAMTCALAAPALAQSKPVEYRVLATTRTSTMEKELNDAAAAGFRFQTVMGGETAGGGKETVCGMSRTDAKSHFRYKLLATTRTTTMQKEMQLAADDGFEYKGQTVFESLLGGREVVIIMELDKDRPATGWNYRLSATNRTSTLEKELAELGDLGYQIVGMTVGQTLTGGRTQAGRDLRYLRAAYNFGALKYQLNAKVGNPFEELNKLRKGWYAVRAKTNIVATVEGDLASWWVAVEGLRQQVKPWGSRDVIADYLQLALLWGGRRGETGRSR